MPNYCNLLLHKFDSSQLFLGTGFCISGVWSQARKHDIAGFHHLPTQSSSKIWLKVHTGWIKVWGTVSCEWLLTVSKLPLCMSSMGGRKRSARVLSFLSTVPPLRSSCSWRTRNRKTFIRPLLEVKMPQQKYETDFEWWLLGNSTTTFDLL